MPAATRGGRVAALVALLGWAATAGAQPANDDCANATVIGSLPFADEVDTTLATLEGGEPASTCAPAGNSIWYRFTAGPTDVNLYVDTIDSDHSVSHSVHPGTCGAFGAEIPLCGRGADNGAFRIPAGTTVYIRVADGKAPAGGGQVSVRIDEVPEFLVTDDGRQYSWQGVAAGPSGDFLVSWTSNSAFDGLAKVFDPTGAPVSGDVMLAPNASDPDAEGLANGNFVTVWASGDDLFARFFDASGSSVGGAFQVNDGAGGYYPRVASSAAGDFVVAWIGPAARARVFNPDGTPKGPQIDLPDNDGEPVDVGMDAAGNFVVAWFDYPNVFAQRFDPTGSALAAPITVDVTEPGGYAYDDIATAMSPSGEFIVAWQAESGNAVVAGMDEELRVRAFDATGAPVGEQFALSRTEYYTQHRVRADADGNGDFIVVWENDAGRPAPEEFADIDMVGRRVSRDGAVAGPQFEVATVNRGWQYDPNVAGGPNGEFIVAWSSYHAREPWGSSYAIPARIFGPDDARFESACAAAPLSGCTTPTLAGAASLSLRDQPDDSKDLLKWKLTKGGATTAADFGNPAQASLLGVCLYDATDTLVFDGRIPPGGDCGTKPCWKALGTPAGSKGYTYKQKAGTPDGIQKLVLKPGEAGKTKIVVKGGKENLAASPTGFAPLPLALPARVQLQSSTGTCWEAVFETASSVTNVSLRAKSAVP